MQDIALTHGSSTGMVAAGMCSADPFAAKL